MTIDNQTDPRNPRRQTTPVTWQVESPVIGQAKSDLIAAKKIVTEIEIEIETELGLAVVGNETEIEIVIPIEIADETVRRIETVNEHARAIASVSVIETASETVIVIADAVPEAKIASETANELVVIDPSLHMQVTTLHIHELDVQNVRPTTTTETILHPGHDQTKTRPEKERKREKRKKKKTLTLSHEKPPIAKES